MRRIMTGRSPGMGLIPATCVPANEWPLFTHSSPSRRTLVPDALPGARTWGWAALAFRPAHGNKEEQRWEP
jgi:hypothetical protein